MASALKMEYAPVAILFAEEKPENALQFVEGRWGCVVAMLTAAAKGRTAVFDRTTVGCSGGRAGLGFGSTYDKVPGGIEYFLSTGRGDGFPEGEGYLKTPELAADFVAALPIVDVPHPYIVFKPLSEVALDRERPEQVVFYATPDQLTALVTLANYDRPGTENAVVLWGAGCQSIGILAYREAQREQSRAVIGMLDVSARPYVPANTLTFTVPFARFLEMEANVAESFFARPAWQKVAVRLPQPTNTCE